MVQKLDLKGKIVLISGGYGYLGSAISRSLVYYGAKVYILARSKKKFEDTFHEVSVSESPLFFKCDISQTNSIEEAFKTIAQKEGRIDVLINNAFYSRGQSPENMTDDEWEYGIDGSLSSVFRSIRAIIPYFKRYGSGKIINVASMYGVVAPQFEIYEQYPEFLNPPHYGAAKAGIIQLTKYYASYLGPENIKVNTVTPGAFPSDEVRKNLAFVRALEQRTCLGRIGLPEDLAGIFVYLASEASNYVTGQNFIIDGGWTAT